jgi:hypothetical protein
MGDQPVARPLPAHRTAQTQNKCTQTFMPQEGFESTIPVFKRAKTVHVLGRAATVTGRIYLVPFANVSRMIKSRRIGRSGHINNMLEKTNIFRISIGKLKGNVLSGDLKDIKTREFTRYR